MKISIVIPAFNQRKNLGVMLETLFPQVEADPDCEAIIVDDGSSDDTYAWASRWCAGHPRFRACTKRNSGPGQARNFGVARSSGDVIAFIDQDCRAMPGWLSALRRSYQADPALMGLEGRTITENDKITPVSHYVVNETGGGYWTCNVSYRRRAFDAAGGFDRDYVVYAEDTDLALKVMKHGRVGFCPEMLVLHPVYPLKIRSAIRKIRFLLHSELLLYCKHPGFYSTHREGGNPTRYFFYFFLFRHLASNINAEKRWLLRAPATYSRYAFQVAGERLYLLLLFDWFLRQRRTIGAL